MLNVQQIAWPLTVILALSAGAMWHAATAQETSKPRVPPELEKASQESKVFPPRQPIERALQAPPNQNEAVPDVQKWEYKKLRGDIEDATLNEVGAEGWELVVVVGADADGPHVAYLKRRK